MTEPKSIQRCPTCGHDREVFNSEEGTSGFVPNEKQWILFSKKLPKSKSVVVMADHRSDVGIDFTVSNGSYARKNWKGWATHWLLLPPHPVRRPSQRKKKP